MASVIDICSNALLLVGAQTISALDEGNDRARLVANLYDGVKNAVIRSHPWNCCIKRVALAPLSESPAFDYAYQFLLPPDCAKILQVGEYRQEIDYRIEAGCILADETAVFLKYVSKDIDESQFDDLLSDAIMYAMASRVAYPLTQSATLQQTMEQKLAMVMREARSVDGQDDPPETLGDNALVNSRFFSTRW